MKTPDEIKKGLELHYNAGSCKECPYTADSEFKKTCFQLLASDALAYIQQLDSRLAQVERERDAAEHDLHLLADGEGACNVCARFDEGYIPTPPHCRYACDDDCFRWRGVCAENTKEDSE